MTETQTLPNWSLVKALRLDSKPDTAEHLLLLSKAHLLALCDNVETPRNSSQQQLVERLVKQQVQYGALDVSMLKSMCNKAGLSQLGTSDDLLIRLTQQKACCRR
jgi:hypothetical protein